MKKVLTIGSTVCDIILNLDHLPVTQEDVHPEKQSTRIGGCAFNTTHAIAHLGVPYTFLSPLGTGIYGDFVRKEIVKHGVRSDVLIEGENGSCLCFVEKDGERTFMSMHGAEYSFQKEWLDALNLSEYTYGYLCGLEVEECNGQELIDAIVDTDIQFMFAPGPRLMHIPSDRMNQLLEHGVMLHLSEREAMLYTGKDNVEDAAEVLHHQTHNLVVVTCGEKGCYIKKEDSFWVESEPVAVADTIGAGDCHCGSFLAALAKGHNLKTCAAFANKVAGKVVSVPYNVLNDEEYNTLKKKI